MVGRSGACICISSRQERPRARSSRPHLNQPLPDPILAVRASAPPGGMPENMESYGMVWHGMIAVAEEWGRRDSWPFGIHARRPIHMYPCYASWLSKPEQHARRSCRDEVAVAAITRDQHSLVRRKPKRGIERSLKRRRAERFCWDILQYRIHESAAARWGLISVQPRHTWTTTSRDRVHLISRFTSIQYISR
ncbi:hypothetical protein BJY01DRAFT_101467 [Aspergillus pseudoustus]|uniref:Uncharacterized protein n=1 Tax=Aspergillus pseudoustus TaxID=1810923 RepID=A0ABR4IX58_9EURO